MKTVTIGEELRALEQETEAALNWARTTNKITDEKMMLAYKAGIHQGWGRARAFFQFKAGMEA